MKKILAFASAALAFGAQAKAADLYQPEPAPQIVEQPVVASANGWYLRGDLSYDIMNMKGAHYYQGSNSLVNDFDSAKLDNTGNLGLGIGYQVNDYFRVDKTFDYLFSTKFRGSTSGTCGNNPCHSRDSSRFSAYGLMANAYVDIYKWGIVTPYVGFGLGGTYVQWDKLKNTIGNDTTVHKGAESWRFTYALMAGFTYDVAAHTKLDLGYRYSRISGGDMGDFSADDQKAGAKNPRSKDDGFGRHEFRAGLRLTTW